MEAYDPFLGENLADPYPAYARYRDAEPIHFSDPRRSWFVFSHEGVRESFRHPSLTAERSRAAKHAQGPRTHTRSIDQEGRAHQVVRGSLTNSLYPMILQFSERVEALVETMSEQMAHSVDRLINELEPAKREIDFITNFAYTLPITVIADLMGIPEQDRDRFENWSHDMARAMDRFYTKNGLDMSGMKPYFEGLVSERQNKPGDDLISRLLAEDWGDDSMTSREIVDLSIGLMLAGHETTVNLLGNGLLALLSDDEQRQRFAADPHRLAKRAVEELLRYDSPAQFISRAVLEDCELCGYELAAGDAVVNVIGAANRDPAVFGDTADQIDVDRFPNQHIAFGIGGHHCPGARLARLETRIAFPRLFERFPDMRLGQQPPIRRPTAVFRGLERLPIVLG